ncbi:IS630 transposase-related protein, partial [Limnospira platensis]|uniref:IS630 transposase-related protein n=1 Tax=Limnospira platensis TaxID=118562 RepID=UPI0025707D10
MRLSPHTAPDVDTPLSWEQGYDPLLCIAQDRTVRTYNGKDIYRRPKKPAPYSYDLRQKVINAIELDGMPKTEASQVFHVSRNTINLWLQ